MRKFSLLLIATGLFSLSTFAQDESNESYADKYSTWSVGLDVGPNLFSGDLSGFYPESNIDGNNIGFGVSVYGNKWLNHLFGLSASVGFNSFTGKGVNTYFTSNEFNYNLDLMFNVSSLIHKGDVDRGNWSWIPYLGWGVSNAYPEVFDANDVLVRGRNSYHNEAQLRGGLLVKYSLNEALDLNFRYMGTAMMFSDWSDNTTSGDFNDATNSIRVGISYNFGASEDRYPIAYARPVSQMAATVASVNERMDMMSMDDDGDGVSNMFDKDNETPEGTVVDGSGVALDVDGDGVADALDQDPFTPRGAQVDATGREMDDDGDGVPNSRDMEPNTPEGEMVNFQGMRISGGMEGDMVNAFLPDVYFNFSSARVSAANEQRLATIAKVMMANEDVTMDVIGHTDPVGSERFNLNLSERRAKAVVDALVNTYGIDAGRFNVVAKGEGAQFGNNNSINRRVEFKVNM